MAKLEVYSIDPMLKQLERMGKLDEIAPKMIDNAMPHVVSALKAALQSHKDTGKLIDSVKANKAKAAKYGGYMASAQFKGYDTGTSHTAEFPRGTPNAVKALGLEVGTIHEPARPFMTGALNKAQPAVEKAMQDTFEAEVNKA